MLDQNLERYIKRINEGEVVKVDFSKKSKVPEKKERKSSMEKWGYRNKERDDAREKARSDDHKKFMDGVKAKKSRVDEDMETYIRDMKFSDIKHSGKSEKRRAKAYEKAQKEHDKRSDPKNWVGGVPPARGRIAAGLKTAKEIATGTALTAAVGGVVGGVHKALGSPIGATHGAAIGAAIGLAGGIKNARKDYKYNRMFHEEDQALFSETELAYLESKLAELDK